jgi:pyrroloquinoline quinone biosynthesis protein B
MHALHLATLGTVLGLITTGLGACATPGTALPDGPYVLVLGTAQDGGLPQIGCVNACCTEARRDPTRRRLVTSLLVVDPASGTRFLFDATPDLPEQVERCRGLPPNRVPPDTGTGGRPRLFDGIFPTHAHIGHYAGLAFLGRETYGSQPTPVYASARMDAYLRSNGPWSLLVEDEAIELTPLVDGTPIELTGGLRVMPIAVPHRDEFTDTFAFLIEGPERAVLYLPDIDKWKRWERPIEELIASVDVALLDGSFFDGSELPNRDMEQIAHPAIVESLARFANLPAGERKKVVFTHLNHSNPAADPESEEAAAVRAAGMSIAWDGLVIEL